MSNVVKNMFNRFFSCFGFIAISSEEYDFLLRQFEIHSLLSDETLSNGNPEIDEYEFYPSDDYDDYYIGPDDNND